MGAAGGREVGGGALRLNGDAHFMREGVPHRPGGAAGSVSAG